MVRYVYHFLFYDINGVAIQLAMLGDNQRLHWCPEPRWEGKGCFINENWADTIIVWVSSTIKMGDHPNLSPSKVLESDSLWALLSHVHMSTCPHVQGISKCRPKDKDCFGKFLNNHLGMSLSSPGQWPSKRAQLSEIICSFHLSTGFLELLPGTSAVGMASKISLSSQMCRRAGNPQIVREMLRSRASLGQHWGAAPNPHRKSRGWRVDWPLSQDPNNEEVVRRRIGKPERFLRCQKSPSWNI